MYFAVIGKNLNISLKELELVNPTMVKANGNILLFESDEFDKIKNLAGVAKRGKIVKEDEIEEYTKDKKMLGTADKDFGLELKRTLGIRRFKIVPVIHTDIEIKKKGIEIIVIDTQSFGIVLGYQNIKLYENIDFEKPGRSMQMGMMPSKLANIMINIGLGEYYKNNKDKPTIYDPFAGSGTTGMLANYMGYDFIGSDINTQYIEQNIERRKTKGFYKKEFCFTAFKHDVTQKLEDNLINPNTVIVSEGRLGPIVKRESTPKQIEEFQYQVLELYKKFFENIKTTTCVITIPYYINQKNFLEDSLIEFGKTIGRKIESVDEVYKRDNQKLGRKILIIS